MAKIYRLSDRISIKIEDITLKLAPLSFDQKMEVQGMVREGIAEDDNLKVLKATRTVMKYCIKDLKGVVDGEDNEYILEFDDKGFLELHIVEELLNMEHSMTLAAVCGQMVAGIPKNDFVDQEGKPLNGVSRVKTKGTRTKKSTSKPKK